MKHFIFSNLLVLLTSCSTAVPPPDIVIENEPLHLATTCKIQMQGGHKVLMCEGTPQFQVDPKCTVIETSTGKALVCE